MELVFVEEGQAFPDPGITRIDNNDSDRTRLLKEILRSTSQLTIGPDPVKERIKEIQQVFPNGSNSPRRTSNSSTDGRRASKGQDARRWTSVSAGVQEEQDESYEDDEALDPADAALRACEQRIDGLCQRLSASESKLMEARSRNSPVYDDHRIKIVARPPDKTPGVARMRADRAAASYLGLHARFPSLEELSTKIDEAPGYESLRELFPRRGRLHPNLYLLTDKSLQNEGDFHKAVWSTETPNAFSALASDNRNRRGDQPQGVGGIGRIKVPLKPTSLKARQVTLANRASHT